jgi:hypothetical protein
MASAFEVQALSMMTTIPRPIVRGWMLHPAGPHRQPGGVLLRTDDCLGLLLVMELIPACQLVLAFFSSKRGGNNGGGR